MNKLIIQYNKATSEIINDSRIDWKRVKVIQGKASRGDANNIANAINKLFQDNSIRFDVICQIINIITTKWYHGHKALKTGFSNFSKNKNINPETIIVNDFLDSLKK